MRKSIGSGMTDNYLAQAIEDEKRAVAPSEPFPLESKEMAMRPNEARTSEQKRCESS